MSYVKYAFIISISVYDDMPYPELDVQYFRAKKYVLPNYFFLKLG